MIDFDDKDLKQYVKNLENAHKYALPDTVRRTLSEEVRLTHAEYKKNIKNELIIRESSSNIVLNSVKYEKAQYKEKDINKMVSFIGQQAKTYGRETEQLRKQEFGETITAKSKHIAKATKFTRGNNYKKTVPKERLLSRINAKKIEDIADNPVKGDVAKQFRQVVAVAHRTHKKIHFIPDSETTRHKFGIFEMWDSGTVVKNGKKHAKGKAAKLLYSFKDKTQKLHERPMLKPATDKIVPKADEIFVKEAEKRLASEMKKGLKG